MVFSLFLKASKIFRSILEMLGNLRVIRKSLSQFVSSLTADHYFWCSGGVPCCFEGVPGYYWMFQGCSGVVPGCSGGVLGMFGVFRGCSGMFRGVPGFTDTRLFALFSITLHAKRPKRAYLLTFLNCHVPF